MTKNLWQKSRETKDTAVVLYTTDNDMIPLRDIQKISSEFIQMVKGVVTVYFDVHYANGAVARIKKIVPTQTKKAKWLGLVEIDAVETDLTMYYKWNPSEEYKEFHKYYESARDNLRRYHRIDLRGVVHK